MEGSSTKIQHTSPLFIAHRGASSLEIENTMDACQKAIDLGFTCIEIDVQLSSDDKVVLYHDMSLKRLTTLNKPVRACTLHELQKLKLNLPNKKTNSIAHFSEVLDLCKGKAQLLIELKGTKKTYPNLVNQIDQDIRASNNTDIILQSFHRPFVKQIAKKTTFPCHQLIHWIKYPLPIIREDTFSVKYLKKYKKLHKKHPTFCGMNFSYKSINKLLVNKIHKMNCTIFAWTVDDPKEIKRCLNCGVDGIITNKPQIHL